MAVYAVLEPPARPDGQPADPDRVRFVRDGFSWGAFLFGPLWMIRHRLWLVLLCWFLVMAGFGVIHAVLGVAPGARALVTVLIALLIGLESGTLRRWTLLRAGWQEQGIVVADDLEAAEQRFFSAEAATGRVHYEPRYDPQHDQAAPDGPAPRRAGVIGLFPFPGTSR